ncbi:MAG: molybdenum cofactor biosynthesis protein MoaE [Chromatiales bacterium]|jgi:molybdopterin synthase catalytic subunit
MIEIRIQSEPFDPSVEMDQLRSGNPAVGGIVSFLGLMRDLNQGEKVSAMHLEYYPGMTEKALRSIVHEACCRWQLLGCRVVHRVGELQPTDVIVLVAVAGVHRGEAFQACEFIIDYLKTRAPFWKKEVTARGARWVDARRSDEIADKKWGV